MTDDDKGSSSTPRIVTDELEKLSKLFENRPSRDKQKELMYKALSEHEVLRHMCPSGALEPIHESLDYYHRYYEDEDPFSYVASLGGSASRASIMILLLWITVQSIPQGEPSRIEELVSETIRGSGLIDSSGSMRELVGMLKKPLPGKIRELVDGLTVESVDYSLHLAEFRRNFAPSQQLEYDVSRDPLSLLHRNSLVLAPRNDRTERLIVWCTDRLSLGCRADNITNLRPDAYWNAYLPQPIQNGRLGAIVGPPTQLETSNASRGRATSPQKDKTQSDWLSTLQSVIGHLSRPFSDREMSGVKARRRLVYLTLSTHPALDHMTPPEHLRQPWYREATVFPILEKARFFKNIPNQEQVRHKARIMIYILWFLGFRLTESRVRILVSTALEDALKRTQSALPSPPPPTTSAVTSTVAPLSDATIFSILSSVRDVVSEIARLIKKPLTAAEQWNPFVRLVADEDGRFLYSTSPEAFSGGVHCLYDVKKCPSALLRSQQAIIVPETKFTEFVIKRLIEDFGLGTHDATVENPYWRVDFAPTREPATVTSPPDSRSSSPVRHVPSVTKSKNFRPGGVSRGHDVVQTVTSSTTQEVREPERRGLEQGEIGISSRSVDAGVIATDGVQTASPGAKPEIRESGREVRQESSGMKPEVLRPVGTKSTSHPSLQVASEGEAKPPPVPTTHEIYSECPRFRILLVGKSGAGKTSLIKHVFHVENLKPSHQVPGKCSIDDEFKSSDNDRLVLHDSQGFEAGEVENFNIVRDFIDRRRKEPHTKDKIHAIWLCTQVPTAGGRALETGVEEFSKLDLGDVPVIFVFTQYDRLYNEVDHSMNDINLVGLDEAGIAALVEKKAQGTFVEKCADPLKTFMRQNSTRPNRKLEYKYVSTHPRYRDTFRDLVKTTDDLARNGVSEAVWLIQATAQRVNVDENVKASIEIGMKKYWRNLASSLAFSQQALRRCFDTIHIDIVNTWNLRDPNEFLLLNEFKAMILACVQDLADPDAPSPNSGFSESCSTISEALGLVTQISPLLGPPAAAIGVSGLFANWLFGAYQNTPGCLRSLMGYIVDLTLILETLFWNTSIPMRPVNFAEVEMAFNSYNGTEKRRSIHQGIRHYVDRMSLLDRAHPDRAHEEVVRLIEAHRNDLGSTDQGKKSKSG